MCCVNNKILKEVLVEIFPYTETFVFTECEFNLIVNAIYMSDYYAMLSPLLYNKSLISLNSHNSIYLVIACPVIYVDVFCSLIDCLNSNSSYFKKVKNYSTSNWAALVQPNVTIKI